VWAANANYDADAEQISEDVTVLQGDVKARQLPALKTECGSFGVDIDALYDQLPTPDQTITAELHSSLAAFETASRDCSDSSSLASAKLKTYEGLMSSADKTYERALSQLVTHGVQ
jgi:hypothetical protein